MRVGGKGGECRVWVACVLGRGVVEAGREAGQGKKEQGCKYNELERNDVKSEPPEAYFHFARGCRPRTRPLAPPGLP